jgi:Ribbon-helix-helix domain
VRLKRQKTRRAFRRKAELFTLWLPPEQKRKLEHLAAKTGVDQSKLARRALGLLFDAFNRGQLELGFPDTMVPESSLGTNKRGA